jgi:hypothetical protein
MLRILFIFFIERSARKNIRERDYGLDNFMPNRVDVRFLPRRYGNPPPFFSYDVSELFEVN